MGYMRHHAIMVTSWHDEKIAEAHARAVEFGACVSEITAAVTNGYRSFFIAPDGSKEGWGESDAGDERRNQFIDWIEGQAHADGSSPIDWVEVAYGGDDYDQAYAERYPFSEGQ